MLLLLLSFAASAGTHCVATDTSRLVYDEGSYVGGAPPPADMAVHWESWSIGKEALYQTSFTAGGQTQTKGEKLDWTWDEATRKVLSTSQPTTFITTTVYRQTVTLTRPAGPIAKGLPSPATVPMRCEQTVDLSPYP